jgi:hypothetical protein
MSAIVHAPPEILDLIFTVYIAQFTDHWARVFARRRLLSLVCRKWKHIVYKSNRHWTYLPVFLFTSPAFINFSLKQTGNADLFIVLDTIIIHRVDPGGPASVKVVCASLISFLQSLQDELAPYAHRIRRLHIQNYTTPELSRLSDILFGWTFGTLQQASYVTVRYGPPLHPVQRLLSHAPRLRRLTFTGFAPSCVAAAYSSGSIAPFQSLTTLVLEDVGAHTPVLWTDVRELLSIMGALRALKLDGAVWTSSDAGLIATLPSLVDLEVRGRSNRTFKTLPLLSAPNLRTLHTDSFCSLATFTENAAHLLPPCTRLDLAASDISCAALATLFILARDVEILDLRRCRGPFLTSILTALTNECLCNMHTVVINDTEGEDSISAVLTAMNSRLSSGDARVVVPMRTSAGDEALCVLDTEWKLVGGRCSSCVIEGPPQPSWGGGPGYVHSDGLL